MDIRDPRFKQCAEELFRLTINPIPRKWYGMNVETSVDSECSIDLGGDSETIRCKVIEGGTLVKVPPCSDCIDRDLDCCCCPEIEQCDNFDCDGCGFQCECDEDMGDKPEAGKPLLDISDLDIEKIDNGWIMSYANEDGEDHQQYFKDTESICKFIEQHIRRP